MIPGVRVVDTHFAVETRAVPARISTPAFKLAGLEKRQRHNLRETPRRHFRTEAQCLQFVNEAGFCVFFPMHGTPIPNLYDAGGGGFWETKDSEDWAWGWKDTLPAKGKCFATFAIRDCSTLVSWETLPAMLAAFRRRHQAPLDADCRRVLQVLGREGALTKRDLRMQFGPGDPKKTRRLNEALKTLGSRFQVAVAGGVQEHWRQHIWDLAERRIPAAVQRAAKKLSEHAGRVILAERYVRAVVFTTPADLRWLFQWKKAEGDAVVADLLKSKAILEAEVKGLEGRFLVALAN